MTENLRYILAIWSPQGWEWIVILVIALIIFGNRLPDVARSIGKSLNMFKKGLKEGEEAKDEIEDEVKKAAGDAAKESKKASDQDA